MKSKWMIGLLVFFMTGCFASPKLVPQNGKDYKIVHRSASKFVYIDYYFDGYFNFDEAVKLETQVFQWAEKRGIAQQAIARFPGAGRLWQIGFVASELPEEPKFQDYDLHVMDLPAGKYAVLYGTGNTAHYFKYWESLKQTLIADGYEVVSPVMEIYIDMFYDDIPKDQQRGGLMYQVR